MATQAGGKVPQIRFKGFKGFEGEWKDQTLGEIGQVAMNKRIFKYQTSEVGEIPFFKIGSFGGTPDSFISRELFEGYKRRYPYPLKGDLLISASGSIGKVVEYQGQDEYFQDSNIVWLQHSGQIENSFLKQFYAFVKWAGLEGSTIKRLYNKTILQTKIILPALQEQTQIGTYFRELDSLINLHQRKHDKLLTLKKAMLQKMFPQAGAAVPEVRFGGFEGDWVERKVAELGEVVTGSTPSTLNQKFYNENGIPWVTPTDINNNITFKVAKHISTEGEKVSRVVPINTILVTCIASIGKNTLLGTRGSFNQQINGLVPFTQNFDPYYLFVSSILWSQKMKMTASAGTMQIVNKSEFSELKTFTPSLSEQQKIGSYFRQLDELIDKHASQLQKLKQIKSACLARMFV